MIINCLKLPPLFTEIILTGKLQWEIGSLQLKVNKDAYGKKLETEIGDIFDTFEKLLKAQKNLPIGFEPNEYYGKPAPDLESPGAIPDILDFLKVLCFAVSGDDSPFCFDYRETFDKPSVVWWDDVYWRRIAPDFKSFLNLFNIGKYLQ